MVPRSGSFPRLPNQSQQPQSAMNNNQQLPIPFNGVSMPNMPNPMPNQPGFMNGPNNHMGMANFGSPPGNPQMGFGPQCGNMNPNRPFGHNNNVSGFPQFNPNAMNLPFGQFCVPNGVGFQGMNQFVGIQMAPNASHFVHPNGFATMVAQNPSFINPQFANMHYNKNLPMQMADANSVNPSPLTAHQGNSSNNATRSNHSEQNNNNLRHFGAQGNSGRNDGFNASRVNWKNQSNKNFGRNPKRGMQQGGHQNPQFNQTRGGKRNFGSSNARGRGPSYDKPAQPRFTNQGKELRKPLTLTYSEQEVQKWCDERRKNYPSKGNIDKKLADKVANKESIEKEAQLRREQLKEILAKQAVLGVEVAEIPGIYLSDSKKPCQGRRDSNGKFQNRFEKRGRHDKKDRYPKKQRLNDSAPSLRPKKLTLLEKLLSTDVKRDKTHLLQAFRFILLNSFFDGSTDKPLKFPTVLVDDVADRNAREIVADVGDETIIGEVESDGDKCDRNKREGEEEREEEGEII